MNQKYGHRDSFKNLMERYPDVASFIAHLALNPRQRRLTIPEILEMLLMELKDKGLSDQDYPFYLKSRGYYGLLLHVKKLRTDLNNKQKMQIRRCRCG